MQLTREVHSEWEEGYSSQQTHNGIEERQQAGDDGGEHNYDGSVDQAQGADGQHKAKDAQVVASVHDVRLGEEVAGVALKRLHDWLHVNLVASNQMHEDEDVCRGDQPSTQTL